MTTRERWYKLHHARRSFSREQAKRVADLIKQGDVPQFYLMQAIDRLINPPMIYDPELGYSV